MWQATSLVHATAIDIEQTTFFVVVVVKLNSGTFFSLRAGRINIKIWTLMERIAIWTTVIFRSSTNC